MWFRQGDPSIGSGYAMLFGSIPGHYAAQIKFPDGYVVYLDNGWTGTGGIFSFNSVVIPGPCKQIRDGTGSASPEPGWPKKPGKPKGPPAMKMTQTN